MRSRFLESVLVRREVCGARAVGGGEMLLVVGEGLDHKEVLIVSRVQGTPCRDLFGVSTSPRVANGVGAGRSGRLRG